MSDLNQGASIEAELLPCPFCGSDAVTDFIDDESYLIECNLCVCRTSCCDSKAEAITAWNRRTPADAVGAGELPPLPSMKEIDAIVYKCRQSGKDTTYDIVHAAIAADRAQRKQAGQGEPVYQINAGRGWDDVEKWRFDLFNENSDGSIKTRIVYLAAPASAQPDQRESAAEGQDSANNGAEGEKNAN